MKGHYGLLATMLFAAILNLNWKDAVNIIATLTILLQAIISAFLFFRRRAIAVVQIELVVFQITVYQSYTNISLILQDDINESTVPGNSVSISSTTMRYLSAWSFLYQL